MKISKERIIQIIEEEISSVLNENTDEGLKKTFGALATAIVTALVPAKASAHDDGPQLRDITTSVRQQEISFQEVSGHENCYVSDSVISQFSRPEINSVFADYESAKREIKQYFSNRENLRKLIKLSSEEDVVEIPEIEDYYMNSAIRNMKIGFSELKFKVISHEEMRRTQNRAEGVFFLEKNEIHIDMELITHHAADIASIIKHELHHAASDYINTFLHFYKDKTSYEKYSPGYQNQEDSVDREHDDYLKHPWENSAYSYAARKLFHLDSAPSKKDVIDGFKEYGIDIVPSTGGMYVIKIPTREDSNPVGADISLAFIFSKMNEKIGTYMGPVGKADISQTLSSIKPFIKKFNYDIDKDEYQLIFDLQEYTNMLNKTAKLEKSVKGITVEKKIKRIKK